MHRDQPASRARRDEVSNHLVELHASKMKTAVTARSAVTGRMFASSRMLSAHLSQSGKELVGDSINHW
jgi:hypothetical protein